MALKRVFLLGSNRAEFEHVHGPLPVDESDPRFVLVDEETEQKILEFPPGVPPVSSQDFEQVKRIRDAQEAADSDVKVQKGDPIGLPQEGGKSVAQSSRPVLNENPAYGEAEFLAAQSEEDSEESKKSSSKARSARSRSKK